MAIWCQIRDSMTRAIRNWGNTTGEFESRKLAESKYWFLYSIAYVVVALASRKTRIGACKTELSRIKCPRTNFVWLKYHIIICIFFVLFCFPFFLFSFKPWNVCNLLILFKEFYINMFFVCLYVCPNTIFFKVKRIAFNHGASWVNVF